jgi:microcystin-dependent protein
LAALKALKVLFTGELLAGNITITTNTIQVNNPGELGSKIDIKAPYINLIASGRDDSKVSVPNNFIVGNNVLFIDTSNNKVGINTSSPAYELDVSGNINFTGNLYKNGVPFETGTGGTIGIVGQYAEDPTPIGCILPYTNNDTPLGWMKCDGRDLLIAEYPDLYATIGTTYGTSDDPLYFKLPDLRGRGIIGEGQGNDLSIRPLGGIGGEETHTLNINELPSHSHRVLVSNSEAGLEFADNGKEDVLVGDHGGAYLNTTTNTAQPFIEPSGGGQPFSTMSPFLVCNYIIKVRSITNDAINIVDGLVGIGIDTPEAKLHVNGNVKIDGVLNMNNITFIDTEGKIGIGKTPQYPLDVIGDINFTGDLLYNGVKLKDPIPVGTIIPYTSLTIPDGWLTCDGRELSRSEFIELFTVIGTTYGIGNGLTTFNVPDLRGRDIIGIGQGASMTDRNLGQQGGSETKVLTINQLPSHTHGILVSSSTAGLEFADNGKEDVLVGDHGGVYLNNTTNSLQPFIQSTGNNDPIDIMPPFLVCNYIIKAISIPSLFGTPYNHWTKNTDNTLTYTNGTVIVNSLQVNNSLRQTIIDGTIYGTSNNPIDGGSFIINNNSVIIELSTGDASLNIDISGGLIGVSGMIILNERNPYGRRIYFPSFSFPEFKPSQTVYGLNQIKYEIVMSNTILAHYQNTQPTKKPINRSVTNNRITSLGYNKLSSLF